MTTSGGGSVSATSSVSGSGGTVFKSRSQGGTSRMATAKRLGPAFVLTLRMTLHVMPGVQGRVAIGPYRGAPEGAGYRFVVLTGAGEGAPAFALERVAGEGSERLATYAGPLRIEDGREREVRWARDSGGEMTVSIDGEEILAAGESALAGPFDGVVLLNSGGDVEVGAIEVGKPD